MKCLIPKVHRKIQDNYINANTNTRTNIIYSRTTTPQTTLANKNRGMATAPRANILSICLTVGCKRWHTYVYLFSYIIYHLLQIIYFLNLPDGQLQKFDDTDILTNNNMFFLTMKRGHMYILRPKFGCPFRAIYKRSNFSRQFLTPLQELPFS